jgi:hypothetical protein
VVRREVAVDWVERLLRIDGHKPEAIAFALLHIARCTGDRARDLDEPIRRQVAERLVGFPAGQRWAKHVLEVVPLEAKEQARIFDEALPVGLQIREGGE